MTKLYGYDRNRQKCTKIYINHNISKVKKEIVWNGMLVY